MASSPLIRDGVVALVVIASSLSSSWRYRLHRNGVLVIIDVIALVARWQPSMRGHLCRCRNGNCCSRHDGVIAFVDAQACLSVVELALSPSPLFIKLVASPTF
jgi:hypothetical protein